MVLIAKPRHFVFIMVALLVAGYVMMLGWPRLQASLLFLPVDTAIKNFQDTSETPAAQLKGLQARALDTLAVYPHHRYWDGLSLLYYLQGTDASNTLAERRERFEQSIDAALESLRRAPSQPRTWLRIAQARAWLRYPPDEVIAALKMTVYTGRVDSALFITRLRLWLAYLPATDEEGLRLLRDQTLLAWQLQQKDFIKAVKSGALPLSRIQALLVDTHSIVLAEMEAILGGNVR